MLVTRPQGQNQVLINALREKGIEPIILPTIEIQFINLNLNWKEILKDVQLIILISQNAVWGLPIDAMAEISIPIITMGEATSKAARERGLEITFTAPAGFTSENLLEIILNRFELQSVVLFKGEEGRDFLEKRLEEKGARVQVIDLYRRVCPKYSDEELEQIFKIAEGDGEGSRIILATSQQSLGNLLKIIKGFSRFDLEKALSLKAWTVVVPSERVQREALAVGFECVRVAGSAGPEAMLATAGSCVTGG
jgi:uroporphyrinogen-III synthase